jgi:signal transduction histidine kinase
VLFAAAAALAVAALAAISYRGVQRALESSFARRIESVAAATASQISPEDVADARAFGEEGTGWATLQVQLEALRATTGVANASLFDSARVTLYDCRDPAAQHEVTPLDSLARAAVAAALAGRPAVSAPFALGGVAHRAALAPVAGPGGGVAGVVAVEARHDHLAVLAEFRRTLTVATLVVVAALGVLALVVARAARDSARLERRLSRAETLAAMGRLTATLAHEIKNPLAVIRGSAQRLGRLEPEARRMADYVVEETDRLSATLERYLRFARGDGEAAGAGGGDAVVALDQTLELLEGEMRSRRVALAREPGGPAAAPVALDNDALKQVYLNLILNALDAMPEGGTLTVAAEERGGRCAMRIADTGAGMPAEVLARIGEPFHTTKPTGSGLGLFLSRRLVQGAGGTLEVESAPGRGTACTVRLPSRRA